MLAFLCWKTEYAYATNARTAWQVNYQTGLDPARRLTQEVLEMRKGASLLGIVIALAVGYYVFKTQYYQGPTGGLPPKEVIDVAGVKMDLLAIGQAERTYLGMHGSYASIEQLQADGAISFSGTNRRGYNYSASVDGGQHFRITAKPADPGKQAWPTLSVDETMQVSQQ